MKNLFLFSCLFFFIPFSWAQDAPLSSLTTYVKMEDGNFSLSRSEEYRYDENGNEINRIFFTHSAQEKTIVKTIGKVYNTNQQLQQINIEKFSGGERTSISYYTFISDNNNNCLLEFERFQGPRGEHPFQPVEKILFHPVGGACQPISAEVFIKARLLVHPPTGEFISSFAPINQLAINQHFVWNSSRREYDLILQKTYETDNTGRLSQQKTSFVDTDEPLSISHWEYSPTGQLIKVKSTYLDENNEPLRLQELAIYEYNSNKKLTSYEEAYLFSFAGEGSIERTTLQYNEGQHLHQSNQHRQVFLGFIEENEERVSFGSNKTYFYNCANQLIEVVEDKSESGNFYFSSAILQHRYTYTQSPDCVLEEVPEAIKISPNPARNRICFDHQYINQANTKLTITNSQGNTVFYTPQATQNCYSTHLQNWRNGIYYVQISNGEKIIRGRFIVL